MLKAKELNILRGKSMNIKLTEEEAIRLFEHIDTLESMLDETDMDDFFGSEGWRHYAGIEE